MGKKAIIENGKIINIIEYSDEQGIRGLRLPLGQQLWDVTNYAAAIGDDFAGGVITREGQSIEAVPTPAQQIAALEAELTSTQLALCEVYELMGGA